MIHVGYIISTMGNVQSPTSFMFSTMGRYHNTCLGDVQSHTFIMISPMVLNIPTVLKISPTVLNTTHSVENTIHMVVVDKWL